jgi:LysR family transcriptional regulator, transcriptional activator of the cysJI operon
VAVFARHIDTATAHYPKIMAARSGWVGRRSTHLQRVIDPLRLRLLLEVDRLGSITRAAEACSMAQPTASTHLRTLEAALGHRLVERAGRATRLTDAGRLLARHAAVVVAALEELEEELVALDGAVTGSLVLACCDSFGDYVLPAMLRTFAHERPRADIRIHVGPSGDVVRAVARGDAHLGIAGQTRRSENVHAEPLLRDELAWVACGRPAALPSVDVHDVTLIVPARESSTRAMTERLLGRSRSRPARVLELDSLEAVKRAVRSEVGVALLSRLAVADELAAGDLREIRFLGGPGVVRTIDILRSEHRQPTPLEQALEQALRLHCDTMRSPLRHATAAANV